MANIELLAYCSKQLAQLSKGISIGDLFDYSKLIESLHDLRYTILSHRNDQLPINRLPVEIFTFICSLTIPDSDPEFIQPNNDPVFWAMKLTHACSHWRSVLISSPEFWTNFRVIKLAPKFVVECIQRSKTLPIHVSFQWYSHDPDYDLSPAGADDDGSVEDDNGNVVGNDGDAADSDSNLVDEDDANQTSDNNPESSRDGTSSHSTLSIYSDFHEAYSWTAYIKEAQNYQYLIQQSHRIATLDIYLPPRPEDEGEEEDNPFACGLFSYPLHALQTLRLRYRERHGSIPQPILDGPIATIKNLFLENIPPTQILGLPLNITSLTLRAARPGITIHTSSFQQFLEMNKGLRSLTLHNCEFPDSAPPMGFSNLHKLVFTSHHTPILRTVEEFSPAPESYFKMEAASQPLCLSAENSTAGTSASVLSLSDPDPDRLLSVISGVFGSGWEESTQVVVAIPVGGWDREVVDRFLNRLTRLSDLTVECRHDRVEPLFDSLGASKERCPNLRQVTLGIAPEHLPNALSSVTRLVKRRAEDGSPLEAVEHMYLSDFAAVIWQDLYDRWEIEDYLKARDP